MNIQESKLELLKRIIDIDNEKLVDQLLDILRSGNKDFWTDLSLKEKEEIQLGIEQLNAGLRVSWEDFLSKAS